MNDLISKDFDCGKDIILVALSGEVPPAWLWFAYEDEKSRQAWDELRRYFQKVYWRIKNYYSGVKLFQVEPDSLDEEFYQLNSSLYTTLYDLIWKNWEEVSQELNLLYAIKNCEFFKIQSPGECLRRVILEDCMCFFLEQKQETSFTKRSLYEFYTLQSKAVASGDEKKLQKYVRYRNRLEAFGKPHILLDNCLAVCRDSKNSYVKQILKLYDMICGDLKRVIQARNHPNRKRISLS